LRCAKKRFLFIGLLPFVIDSNGFEKQTGHRVVLSFGATGRLYAQISNGAPFDIFLAADDEIPARLEREGVAVKSSRFTYATGKLVLWSAKPGLVDTKGEILKTGDFKKLAIAAPKLAPYGAAALQAINKLGLLNRLESRIVTGESKGQAYSFVATGNAELGFFALSLLYENGQIKSGSVWVVPDMLYRPIRQDAVLLSNGAGNQAAAMLLAFLKTENAKAMMRAFGYIH
jgi:molybdate transport system substrate-binding protein